MPGAVSPDQFSNFGDLVKYLRRRAQITQRELAIAVGYSDTQISRIEHGQRVPDAATITALFVPALYIEREPELVERLLELAGQPPAASSIDSKPEVPNNLPVQISSFIGRKKEIEEAAQLVKSFRLVTLTGSGGTGKTRLSLQAASSLLSGFPDGVWFVEFAPLHDPVFVPFLLANLIGLRESTRTQSTISESLIEYFRARKSLLVFDNCEHLLEPIARLVQTLLQACEGVVILASSLEPFGIPGEVTYIVPPLSIPDLEADPAVWPESESMKLFIERASAASPGFSLAEEEAANAAQICSRLDGVPFAIELAAARVRMMNLAEIAARLDDRFRLLTGGARTGLPRQQTLRTMIDWSYDLLSEGEKDIFRKLAVFSGGWTLDAAEDICRGDGIEGGQFLDLMSQLVNKSLVQVDSARTESRYRFLETVRDYAWEKLLETEEAQPVRVRHLAHFVDLAERAQPELYRSDQGSWMEKLSAEIDNLRAALEWAKGSDNQTGMRLFVSLRLFWDVYISTQEKEIHLSQLLKDDPAADPLHALALAYYGITLAYQGKFIEAQQFTNQGLELALSISDRQSEAYSLFGLGLCNWFQGYEEQAVAFLEQSLARYESLGDKLGQASALTYLGTNFYLDPKTGVSHLKESLRLHRELGNLSGIAHSLDELSFRLILQDDISTPIAMLDEAIDLYRQLGNSMGEAQVLISFGHLSLQQERFRDARSYFEKANELRRNSGDLIYSLWLRASLGISLQKLGETELATELFRQCLLEFQRTNALDGIAFTIQRLAILYADQNEIDLATKLFAWAAQARDQIGFRHRPFETKTIDRYMAVIQGGADEAHIFRLEVQGRGLSTEQAVALALSGMGGH